MNRMDQDLTSEIISEISDITVSMKAEDYLKMPKKINNEVFVNLSYKERDIYGTLRKDLVYSLRGYLSVYLTNSDCFSIL